MGPCLRRDPINVRRCSALTVVLDALARTCQNITIWWFVSGPDRMQEPSADTGHNATKTAISGLSVQHSILSGSIFSCGLPMSQLAADMPASNLSELPPVPDRVWPGDLTRVPYWVYRDHGSAEDRTGAGLRGPGLEFPVPGKRDRQSRRLAGDSRRPDAGGGRARYRRLDRRIREPLRASRRADLPGQCRQRRQGFPVRLSRVALRSARQSEIGRISARGERQRRHAARFPAWRITARASLRVTTLHGLVFGTLSDDTPAIEDFIGPGRAGAIQPRRSAAGRSRSSAALSKCCRTTGRCTRRTCATPIMPACCICSSRRSSSTG